MVPVGAIVPNPNALAFWTVLAQLGPSLSQQKQLAMRPQASIFNLGRGRCRSEGELKEGIEALNSYGWLSILPHDIPWYSIKSCQIPTDG